MGRYLGQIATILAPASMDAADLALRQFASYLIDEPHIDTIAAVDRDVAEDYKAWLAAQSGHNGECLSVNPDHPYNTESGARGPVSTDARSPALGVAEPVSPTSFMARWMARAGERGAVVRVGLDLPLRRDARSRRV
jgi:hypothetical protein